MRSVGALQRRLSAAAAVTLRLAASGVVQRRGSKRCVEGVDAVAA